MIERPFLLEQVKIALDRNPVVALVGPRQVGKTTLARNFVALGDPNYFDLEDPLSQVRLSEPMLTLGAMQGLIVIDEVQHAPDLFKVLRVIVDRPENKARFLILGSASPTLLRQSSESLAGRIEVLEMSGFSLAECGFSEMDTLWIRGGFPRSFLARSEADSRSWRKQFLAALVERDMPQLGAGLSAAQLFRLLTMLAHYHGQVWNAAELARSLGLSEPTIRRYLDLLAGMYLIRPLQPWFANLGKRQVKSPKLYFRDTGLLHQLLGIPDQPSLLSHPRCGASWEGFVIEQLIRRHQPDEAYFWATHTGAELDLLLVRDGVRLGIEIKRADAPKLTPSMRHALNDLELDALQVIYPGQLSYSLADQVQALPLLTALTREIFPLSAQ